jgi:hypothetical protein
MNRSATIADWLIAVGCAVILFLIYARVIA